MEKKNGFRNAYSGGHWWCRFHCCSPLCFGGSGLHRWWDSGRFCRCKDDGCRRCCQWRRCCSWKHGGYSSIGWSCRTVCRC
ncbi:uncharacterized protein LOC116988542 isoform X2 [Amblyraja radiata]|uniref:uncharacterized protein LOC116988542 isoform X2 n=1 Tax=Amblyraja radiata TaxID=386614 RepID=UPI001403BB53|nr:uncharacterized protein LOC116988542 isoform X2 [Amblyraja radiata]